MVLAGDDVLHRGSHELVIRIDDRGDCAQELLERLRERPQHLPQTRRGVLACGVHLIRRIRGFDRLLPRVVARLDLASGVVVLDDEHPHILARVLRVVVRNLRTAEQQDRPAPIQAVLVEVVRRGLSLPGTLIVHQRVGLTLLAEHVNLKLGAALQPALKGLGEMRLGHIQPGRWRRWGWRRGRRGRRVAAATAIQVIAYQRAGCGREIRFHGNERQDGDRGRRLRAQQVAVPRRVERDRDVVVAEGGGDEDAAVTAPRGAVRGHGEVQLQGDR